MSGHASTVMSRRALLGSATVLGAGLLAGPLAAFASLFAADEQDHVLVAASDTALGEIPAELLAVYAAAAAERCRGLPWTVLAAIGAIESGHDPAAIGPPLDGSLGVAAIPATPQGTAWHGDPDWEHAVGMMQFLPVTFLAYAVDIAGDGADPFDPADAAGSAAAYLCANGGADLSGLRDALFAYNRADWYVEQVLAKAASYSAAPFGPPAAAGTVSPDYVAVALAQVGKPYRWGAAGPDAFDCSGLTSWSLAQVGVRIPRVSADQARHVAAHGHAISVEAAAGVYGALVFRVGVGAVNHVAISLGDGRTVEAWRTGEPVQTKQLAGRPWTSAGLVPGLVYRAAPSTDTTGLRPAIAAVSGIMPVTGPVDGTFPGTVPGTVAAAARGPLTGTPGGSVAAGRRAGQSTHGVAVGDRHLSLSLRRRPAALAEAQPSVGLLTAPIARHADVRGDNWDRVSELVAGIADTVPQLIEALRAGVVVVAVLVVGWMLVRHVATRRALRPDRRIRLTVLPTDTFDPSEEEVARYAAQLSRTRRAVRIPGRPAQAVRLRLDSTGDGQCAYRIEGAPQVASILKLAGYDETELRPTDDASRPGSEADHA